MVIQELVPGVNLEDYTTEFKARIAESPSAKSGERLENTWLKTIVAFANSGPGDLYIGVDDKTHEIQSLSHEEADTIHLMIQRLSQERITPEPHIVYSAIPVPSTQPTRYVLKVHVEKSTFPLVSLKEGNARSIYFRDFGRDSLATPEQMVEMVHQSSYVSYDDRYLEIKYRKEDFRAFNEYYAKVRGEELREKTLMGKNLIDKEGHLSVGFDMFRDDYQSPKTLVECTWFRGYDAGDSVFLASKRIQGNLLYEFQQIAEFIKSRTANGIEKSGLTRIDYVAYPDEALNEAIANALGHRNYFINGSQISINVFKDRAEFISPGDLIGQSRELHQFKDLGSLPPVRRNDLICEAFCLLRLMDRLGTGFDKILDVYRPYGDKFAPFVNSGNQSFCLTLPDLTHENGLYAYNDEPAIELNPSVKGKYDSIILSYCYKQARTAKEIAERIGIGPTSYFRDNILGRLVNEGYLLKIESEYPAKFYANRTKVTLK